MLLVQFYFLFKTLEKRFMLNNFPKNFIKKFTVEKSKKIGN